MVKIDFWVEGIADQKFLSDVISEWFEYDFKWDDKNRVFESTETLIQATDGTTASFKTKSFPTAANPPIAISGQGLSLATGNVCIMVCAATDCSAKPNNRYVIVSQSGHVRVETESSFKGKTTELDPATNTQVEKLVCQ